MPYDPRMMAPQYQPFETENRWWEQPQQPRGQTADLSAPAAPQAKAPPSLMDMLMSSGLMRKGAQGKDGSGNQALGMLGPQGAMFSPLWLGSSMGLPGGAGWGGTSGR